MKHRYILLLFLSLITGKAYTQHNASNIKGKIVDAHKKPIELVSVRILETNQYAITNQQGEFQIPIKSTSTETLTFEFFYIGMQKITKKITINNTKLDIGIIELKELNLSLSEITINAQRNYEGSSNSSLVIDRDLIEQIPALSLNDILNTIPNRKYVPPSLQNVQNITLRTTFNGRDAYSINNAFGVAIIMDGQAISNNANMQSRNPGINGMTNTSVTSGGYGLKGSTAKGYSGDFAFGGTDLRQIPVDNIESVEVISGIAPVQYGDLTDGAIIVNRQAGKSPAYVRMQLRDNATSYSFSKGFLLNKQLGALSVNTNYTSSFQDNRDKLKAYKRLNTGLIWSNTFGQSKNIRNTLSIDYGRNLDGIKRDPEDPYATLARFDSWNFSISNRTNISFKTKFLKSISANIRYGTGHQVTYSEAFRNESFQLYTEETRPGITEGHFAPGIFTAVSHIDGRPLNISGMINANTEVKTGNINHYITIGSNYSYAANKGLGQIVDPSMPRSTIGVIARSTGAKTSERYYDYALANPQKNLGLYAEDMFKIKLAGKDLNIRTGVRFDTQNGYLSVAPRTNINYQLSKKLRIGLAYGTATKAPGLNMRYPGPVFFDVPLLVSSNGNVNESIYLVYVDRFDPDNRHLKPSKSESLEFSMNYKAGDYNISFAAFNKKIIDGITTVLDRKAVVLPTYSATPRPGQKPEVTVTGAKTYLLRFNRFENLLNSTNQGIDIMASSPVFKSIATSFNISGGIYKTSYSSSALREQDVLEPKDDPNYAVIGVYPSSNYASWLSSGRITTTTHIPKISLIATFIAEFDFIQKTTRASNYGIPVGYYTRDGQYITIQNFDASNPNYGHLLMPESELKQNDQKGIYSNFHLSIGKEIKKRLKISFNVYNVFNYRPSYQNTPGSYIQPNSAPSYGAEISLKL